MPKFVTRSLGVLLLAALGVVGVVGIDIASAHGEVPRNVTIDGYHVGGYGEEDLARVLRLVDADHAGDPVVVQVEGMVIETTNAAAGITLDHDAMVAAAMSAHGATSALGERVAEWPSSFADVVDVPLRFQIDPTRVETLVSEHPGRVRAMPVEPFFTGVDGPWTVQPPVAGAELIPSVVSGALTDAVRAGARPFQVTVDWTPIPTNISQAQFATAFASAEAMAQRLTVETNGRVGIIGAESVRRWIDSVVVNGEIFPVFDDDRVLGSVERLFAVYADPLTEPTFRVEDGEVFFELGEPALQCCDPAATDLLWEAVNVDGRIPVVTLPTRYVEEDLGLERALSYGITERVASFTTRHPCCASRVTNIHRIADLIRGQVVAPGESFSVNEFIGPRTRAKGFVAAGVIKAGYFDEDVGGGISQFATTTFNAAFFAGLDIPQYRAHSVYISRYPYGREATLNHPQPDLEIHNNTPHHLMIWTSYTATSITVSIYSTPYWDVEQTGQFTTRVGQCRSVTTIRERTDPDGNVLEDRFFAFYRPGNGLDCNGKLIPRN